MSGGLQQGQAAAGGSHASAQFVALLDGAPVSLHADACVELRSRYAECGHCTRNCPPRALRFTDRGLELREACIGCGRCVAACPTGALKVAGFAAPARELGGGRHPVTVDCWKVPATVPATVRVPCLGGLPVSRIMALRVEAGEREVEFRDRGWCAGCSAGKGTDEHPLLKSLERARARMRDAGVPERLLPRLAAEPLPHRQMTAEFEADRVGQRGSRRGFFARMAPSQTIAEAWGAGESARPRAARPKAPAAERVAVLKHLGTLARRHGGRVSAQLFHAVEVDGRCAGHSVCAANCPTGALRRDLDENGRATLSHDTVLCIGCGQCERVCAEQALHLRHGSGRPGARAILKRFDLQACSACGTEFPALSDSDGPATCDRCTKSRRLAHSAFQQLFRAQVRPAP